MVYAGGSLFQPRNAEGEYKLWESLLAMEDMSVPSPGGHLLVTGDDCSFDITVTVLHVAEHVLQSG